MKTYSVSKSIDTSKCQTDEELFDALEYVHCKFYMEQLENRLLDMQLKMKMIESSICRLKDQLAKYERYTDAYKDVYPHRPWEARESDPVERRG